MKDPFTSRAKREELKKEATRNRRIKIALAAGVGLVAILAVLYFAVFSGKLGGARDVLNQEEKDAANLKFIDQLLNDLSVSLAEKDITASMKGVYQREKKDLEQQREEILKKRPDLKK